MKLPHDCVCLVPYPARRCLPSRSVSPRSSSNAPHSRAQSGARWPSPGAPALAPWGVGDSMAHRVGSRDGLAEDTRRDPGAGPVVSAMQGLSAPIRKLMPNRYGISQHSPKHTTLRRLQVSRWIDMTGDYTHSCRETTLTDWVFLGWIRHDWKIEIMSISFLANSSPKYLWDPLGGRFSAWNRVWRRDPMRALSALNL